MTGEALYVFSGPQIAYLGREQVERAGRCPDCAEEYEEGDWQLAETVFRVKDERGEAKVFVNAQETMDWATGRGRVEITCIKVMPPT